MPRSRWLALIGLVALAALVWGVFQLTQSRTPLSRVTREIRAQIQERDVHLRGTSRAEASANWSLVRSFYKKRNYKPAWTDGRGAEAQAEQLAEAVAHSGRDGLSPRDYDQAELAASIRKLKTNPLADSPPAAELAELDVRATFTYFRLANHLLNGRVSPRSLDPDWRTSPREANLVGNLEEAIRKHRIEQTLEELSPKDKRYERLQMAWDRYAEIAEHGGWPILAEGAPPKPGQSGPRVTTLIERLAATGDVAAPSPKSYDGTVGEGLRHFQARHGITPTGLVDERTAAALRVSVEDRLQQIRVNLERWRWLPEDLGERYVLVNIPDFRLDVFEGERRVMSMPVVVGKRMSPTPTFSDQAVAVEVNPYWNVPSSIARAEIAPRVAEDRDYLARAHLRVLSQPGEGGEEMDASHVDWSDTSSDQVYALRQDPGPDNPLGRIKIALPNEYDVYLHDTPAGHLFSEKERDFSHGCIRVARPLDLATYLLRGSAEGSPEHLQQLIAEGTNHWIALPRKVPVHILYWTAWVDPDGTVEFRDDVYGHDARLGRALRSGSVSSFRVNPL